MRMNKENKTAYNATVSAGVVVKRNTNSLDFEVLYIVRESGNFGIPAGHLEPGETPRQCAVREFLEETGYHVTLTGLIKVVTLFDEKTRRTSVGFIFRGEIGEKAQEGEHETRWVTATQTIQELGNTHLTSFHIPAVWGDEYPLEIMFERTLPKR